MPKQMAVFAAHAAGIMPLGFIGTVAEFHDLDRFRQTIRRSRRLGFIGASVIHPSQIPILNEEFRSGAEEVDHARRVVAAYEEALAEGIGAVTVDGKMIDVPIVERARLLLERETAIAAREAKMRETAAFPPPRAWRVRVGLRLRRSAAATTGGSRPALLRGRNGRSRSARR
jgi:citrate lyase subunit beta / citryl-CoA lyase